MAIKDKQKMYRVRGPDGLWVKKGDYLRPIVWVEKEEQATFWKKLHHLKASMTDGIFSKDENLDGLPIAALTVYEYEVTVERTGRKQRMSELVKFHTDDKENDDGKAGI